MPYTLRVMDRTRLASIVYLRAITLAATISAVVSSASACGASSQTSSSTPSVTTTAPDFTARDLDGKTFRLSDHLGREVVLLDFWSTFCEPCKAEFPHLRAMYERDKSRGLLVVGVSMDGPESVADVPAFARRYAIGFPIIFDDDSRIASLYDPKKSMPLSVLISREGRILVVREGYNPGDEGLVEADVARALAEAPAAR